MDFEKILESISSGRVRKNKEEIRGIIQANLSPSQIFLLRSHLSTIDAVTKQITEIDAKISDQISMRNEDMRIALSMPGMGFIHETRYPLPLRMVFTSKDVRVSLSPHQGIPSSPEDHPGPRMPR